MAIGLIDKITEALNKRANDHKFLAKIYAEIEAYNENEIIGHNINGSPLTKPLLEKQIIEASEKVKNGDFYTSEEVSKMIDSW